MFWSIDGPWISLNEVHVRVHRYQHSAKLKTSRMSMHIPKLPLGYQLTMNNSRIVIMNIDIKMCKISGHNIEQKIEVAKLDLFLRQHKSIGSQNNTIFMCILKVASQQEHKKMGMIWIPTLSRN